MEELRIKAAEKRGEAVLGNGSDWIAGDDADATSSNGEKEDVNQVKISTA